jgi:ABC-type Fe3+-siderophore transport system permease subunit
MRAPPSTTDLMVSWIATAAIVILLSRINPHSPWLVACGAFFLTAVVISIFFGRGSWVPLGLMLVGVGIGVFLDVIYDQITNALDRTLFPIEIALWCGISAVPLTAGYGLGKWVRSKYSNAEP